MITLRNVSKTFHGSAERNVHAVREVNLEIEAGEIFGIIGRSGAGKSTLVRVINLLTRPDAGEVVVDGRDLTRLDAAELRAARREIGMIFQHFNLMSSRTVAANVALPLELIGRPKEEIRREVARLLDLVGLTAESDRYPEQLSGGQKQRVGIARALACNPKVLLSDEATSALDPETTRSILDLLKHINSELGLTIVLITHQMRVVKQICDRIAVMDAGRIVECGPVLSVFRAPKSEVTRSMIGEVISSELPESVLQRVRRRIEARNGDGPPDHLLRLIFVGDDVDRPLLSEAVKRFGIDFNILHGQIDEVQGRGFSSLTLLANGSREALDGALSLLREHDITVEEIDHVL
ncbi:MAG: methionine ABC transporter ATP-binding protein [Candidatus Accumulibacter sp.]|jgi:D-methionine transport system ATP-binding protein|nr:methionine ABC transporter ATP-binding protein [Accumulibacter sp.]